MRCGRKYPATYYRVAGTQNLASVLVYLRCFGTVFGRFLPFPRGRKRPRAVVRRRLRNRVRFIDTFQSIIHSCLRLLPDLLDYKESLRLGVQCKQQESLSIKQRQQKAGQWIQVTQSSNARLESFAKKSPSNALISDEL